MRLIGVDCAVNPRAVGVALAKLDDTIDVQAIHASIGDPWGQVAEWIEASPVETLVAIDAPLGWPVPLAQALPGHIAGAPITADANDVFRRTTDRLVQDAIGKRPLDVGADRIARTAHAALNQLEQLRGRTNLSLPLAWKPGHVTGVHVIEVYPAATLHAHGLPSQGYKKGDAPDHRCVRQQILGGLLASLELKDSDRSVALANADGLDAVVCLLAAADFVRGTARAPEDRELARVEGWIWCRQAPC